MFPKKIGTSEYGIHLIFGKRGIEKNIKWEKIEDISTVRVGVQIRKQPTLRWIIFQKDKENVIIGIADKEIPREIIQNIQQAFNNQKNNRP
jgi:hypothetical protein